MNNSDPIINLFTTLAEGFRAALDLEMAQLDFKRVKWEQHQEMEHTKHLLLGFQLFFLILIFLLLAVTPLASMALQSINHESIEHTVPLHPMVAPQPPVPRQLNPEPSLPTVWEVFPMTISDLVPNLQPMVEQISQQLRFVCFFILTGSLIVRTSTGNKSVLQLMRPLVTNIFLCGLIATLPFWFNLIRDEFWNIAVTIRVDFTGSVANTGAALMNLLQVPENGSNWIDVTGSLEKAVQFAFGWMIVCFAGMIQLPMMLIQYVMECLCYLFLPIALCLFAFESTKGLAIHYVQQTLAVLAWPIGFAIVDLVGFSLLTSTTNAITGGNLPGGNAPTFGPSTYLFSGIVAVWLILGSLVTPIIMQALFCSGAPLSSAMAHSIQMGLALAGMSKFLGGPAGAAAPTGSDASGNSGSAPAPAPSSPRPPPSQPSAGLAGPSISPGEPASPSSPRPAGASGLIQSPRGTLAVGKVADSISPAQAQSMADQSGTPFTQAFSHGGVVTHQPAVSKVPAAATFLPTSTPPPLAL